ncbi:MAG: NYN domain-containing protein, partial [Deltaproteobacteria bacterium]|nr:NYN domain-containing protein [Deltaproteobacteria bacterium]
MQRLLESQSRSRVADSSEDLGGIALFFDVENILLGIQGELDVHAVTRFLGERGEVMILRAYADWGRYRRQQRQFLDEGVQMVFLPTYGASDKNRTDTAICVDAMEILYTRPLIETFCIISGDSDFGILANRLRDHGKRIIGISARTAASPVLVKQCHEFVYYETLVGQRVAGFSVEEGEGRLKRALERIVEEVGPEFRASVLKDRMRKQDATFSERNYGASSFTR